MSFSMFNILMSSTCLNSTLFPIYMFVGYTLVIWIIFEAHSFSVSVISFQKNSAFCSVLYNACLSCTFNIGFTFCTIVDPTSQLILQ